MYSNIDLDHVLPIMRHWFESYVPLPGKAPLTNMNALMSALNIVMRWNICKFGDVYIKQLIGTAMGTSCAVVFANLYLGAHEKHKILPVFKDHLKKILYYRRYVDDVFFIWTGTCNEIWDKLILTFNTFGILKWEPSLPTNSVNFLNLTLTIEGNQIITKSYQKPSNPYLYIPPHSIHSPGTVNDWIYGILKTYWRQNSNYKDFISFSNLLFNCHIRQGWDQAVLKDIFVSALNKLKNSLEVTTILTNDMTTSLPQNNKNNCNNKQLFLHIKYHPGDIPKHDIGKNIF
ncbi:hypothetical protein ACHAW6_010132 [Cyclotella cf. meneghiniana]